MNPISKVDYFVGVFLASILGRAKQVPALIDETNDSKKVEFWTNTNSYNVYVKFSTARHNRAASRDGKTKEKTYWKVAFSSLEHEKLSTFFLESYKNCVAFVCTDEKLTETWIAVLDYDEAMHCLQSKTKGGNRTITVRRIGKAHQFQFSGVDFDEQDIVTAPFDYTLYFQ